MTLTVVLPIGSGDCTVTWGRPSIDSGGRTPPRRKRGVMRGLRMSPGVGGSESNALLGSQERNVRWSRVSACVAGDAGAGLERVPGDAADPALVLKLVVLEVALSGTRAHATSGRRDGKNRRGGTFVVFDMARGDVDAIVESSASASPLAPVLLRSRPDERRRDVNSVKSTVRERAGRRRMDG
jgi:hypothetical protein